MIYNIICAWIVYVHCDFFCNGRNRFLLFNIYRKESHQKWYYITISLNPHLKRLMFSLTLAAYILGWKVEFLKVRFFVYCKRRNAVPYVIRIVFCIHMRILWISQRFIMKWKIVMNKYILSLENFSRALIRRKKQLLNRQRRQRRPFRSEKVEPEPVSPEPLEGF